VYVSAKTIVLFNTKDTSPKGINRIAPAR